MNYKLKDKDKLTFTGKQLKEFKKKIKQECQEELRKANISISTYKDLWQQAEKRIIEIKDERCKKYEANINFLRSISAGVEK